MIVVREYVDEAGRNPFGTWFASLDSTAAVRVTVALERIAQGHQSAMKSVGDGVLEYKLDFGPGYRIYFGKDGGSSRHPGGWRDEATARQRH